MTEKGSQKSPISTKCYRYTKSMRDHRQSCAVYDGISRRILRWLDAINSSKNEMFGSLRSVTGSCVDFLKGGEVVLAVTRVEILNFQIISSQKQFFLGNGRDDICDLKYKLWTTESENR